MEELNISLLQYNDQLRMVTEALQTVIDNTERESLLELQIELRQLIQLTQESLDATSMKTSNVNTSSAKAIPMNEEKSELDDEYALFMDELATLLGMKCAVYHTHKWGGQPSLHNAMVSAVVPRQDNDQFKDLQVRVLFTHPTHTEMLPCPYFLDGECKFDDEKCRYSHGAVVALSDLKEAIEPNFDTIKIGSRILLKLKPPDDEDISLTKRTTEKYHLWHRALVKHVDFEKRICLAKLEHGAKSGDKRKSSSDELHVRFEELFPLTTAGEHDSDGDHSISDTEYPESKTMRAEEFDAGSLLVEQSLHTNGPAIGEWERHTRGIGSKLMLAMGYVPGRGLGAEGGGRVAPVEARLLPAGKSLDHCMAISEKAAGQDPLKVEQKLKRLQKKEEERNKRAYEREKDKEKRNVFNFLNRTLGDRWDDEENSSVSPTVDIKQSTSKDLNIEQFKVTEDTRRLEKEILKLTSSLGRHSAGSDGHRSINLQILEKNKELSALRNKEQLITKEQRHRKDKQKMSIF